LLSDLSASHGRSCDAEEAPVGAGVMALKQAEFHSVSPSHLAQTRCIRSPKSPTGPTSGSLEFDPPENRITLLGPTSVPSSRMIEMEVTVPHTPPHHGKASNAARFSSSLFLPLG
jgi:hypothetical protein